MSSVESSMSVDDQVGNGRDQPMTEQREDQVIVSEDGCPLLPLSRMKAVGSGEQVSSKATRL